MSRSFDTSNFSPSGNAAAPTPASALGTSALRSSLRKVIVIGASTGGPQALDIVLKGLGAALQHAPIFIVLHIPSEFTSVVAQHIEKSTGLPTHVAKHGEAVEKGRIYFAPGGAHMGLTRVGLTSRVVLTDDPPQNFCKPAVDVLFRTAAQCFGSNVIGAVLTGMGADGLEGSRAIVKAGGKVIAQDAASSTVWGMPGAVANNGLAQAVLPVGMIAAAVYGLLDAQPFVCEKRP